jgi:acetylornithine deacetylase
MDNLKYKVLENLNEEELINLTKEICKFPSYSGEETPCANFLAGFMEENGFEVDLQEVEPGRFQPIGTIKGDGTGPSLMFNGHMDIGPVLMHTWTKNDPYDPYVKDGRIHGHGIENMKGGVAAMVMAAVAVKRADIQLKGDLVVACVVGELQGGVGTKHLVDNGVITDYALDPEPSGLTVRTATAGCGEFLIHVFGLDKRVNAFKKMIRVYEALEEASRTKDFTYTYFPGKPELPVINIGGVIGGLGREHSFLRCPPGNPDFCTVGIDIRTVPGQTEESLKADLIRILSRLKVEDPDFHFEVHGPPATYNEKWPLFKHFIQPANISPDEWIVKLTAKNHEVVTGNKAVVWSQPHQYAYNDCGHLQEAGIKAVTYGPISAPSQLLSRPEAAGGLARAFFYPDGSTEDCMEIFQVVTTAKVYALSAVDVCISTKK